MTYNIESEADLIKALKECRDGDEITSDELIEVTAVELLINKAVKFSEVTLNMITREKCPTSDIKGSLIVTKGCEFVDCYIYGDDNGKPTTWQNDGLQALIKADGASYLIMDNCQLTNGSYMGVWLFDCVYSNIINTQIEDCATRKEKYGFGYGIWQGGKGNAWNQVLNVTGCTFSHNRHCIAGSKHVNHIYVSDCDFYGGEFSQHILDRHGDNQIGGGNYFIIDNRFHAEDRFAFDLAKTGDDIDMIRIEGNTFARPFGKNGRIGGVSEEQFEVFRNNVYKP